MEELLAQLKDKLQAAAGANLKAIVLFGSAARGEYHARHSDLNVLCVLGRTHAEDLEALHEAAAWWEQKKFPAPQIFTLDELRASADIFAIELLDMKTHHRMIYGEDFFEGLDVPMKLHRLQVERELRTNWVKLRQGILMAPHKERVLMRLMDASVSTFVTLFRHALIVLGGDPPAGRRDVIAEIARLSGGRPDAFLAVLDVREGKRQARDVKARETLRDYLDMVERVTDEVDRRLSGSI
ncbi:MAG: nucleotidyltransferase domain-containing protein [Acidobacteria bacterium]|nr:MAG: nucleotidyltransferase domain-containing protein [Acidobacteriota bacterium]